MAFQGGLFTFYTLTPLHAGSGDAADIIDLPVQREKHTQYPEVYSSSLKGSLRYYYECRFGKGDVANGIFGKEGDEGAAGGVVFTDAKVLFFPVRSSEGVFKWITCQFVLDRLKRDIGFLNEPFPVDLLNSSAQSDTNGSYFYLFHV
ncbi:MAG: type III-B CRISPR module RAMP protein Cmr4, partial [Nitrososphaerota archaeon]|nr:type III-B CRISPR module RAMP protein Cmr4 [Nitrososphaerota archaeon]